MRGVNKLVVEINNPDSEYFERAILFLKSDKINAPQSEINQNADKLLSVVMKGQKREKKIKITLFLLGLLGAAMVVTGIAMLICMF